MPLSFLVDNLEKPYYSCYNKELTAEVAEWQTRYVQGVVSLRA